ncbi:MAG: amino acid--tRNA ligase-related protein [Myxococcota bacterium]|nr:amino acid--tRNA ligase-related protein [Myxococcota bacterium]
MRVDRLRQRGEILLALRSWFARHGYIEVHTPTIVPAAAMEPHLEPVRLSPTEYLHTSPELAMKRILAAGLGRIYQICPCFREEEVGIHHSREFTMVEWYRAGAGTAELMDEVVDLIGVAAQAIGVPAPQFERRAVSLLLEIDQPADEWMFEWVDRVEPSLTRPTIVYDYPPWQAALSRLREGRADRFEVYLSGIELANAFAEETSGTVLANRLRDGNATRVASGRAPHPVDEDFLRAVDRMPRCAGIAVGLDRLVMALTGAASIAELQVGGPSN